ncbi:Nicotinate phosphoribosyltransferase [Daphnia magna]|uniref:Nicotinate phosphoribosyltransferase n=2 Tax=Daphnia magna TaxID=35525 RepID=A0A162D562_9CRUS|nr:hypothetical protein OUZ56_000165 [Daphnia magna]KZS07054.1 Nicotinate phosphoribosyltransferase [Daphnia magna]
MEATEVKMRQNEIIQPLLTDLYQLTMAYAYWKSGKVDDTAVFDLFFRKNPFSGEFTIFAGLEQCIKFLFNFRYSDSDITYLKQILPPYVEEEFFRYLKNLTVEDVTLFAIPEGSVVFPRVPLLRVEGPLIVVQLLETTFLNLINYSSLIATNAARFRMAAGKRIKLLEFGLRRAQGPDGGLSASKYAYLGGFDGTSNVLAGKLFHIPVKGTHAHAYISSFSTLADLKTRDLAVYDENGSDLIESRDFVETCIKRRDQLATLLGILLQEANDGELAAFISYAMAFPDGFTALVDTYEVLRSGLLNFCAVAVALSDFGYRPIGIRLDSGDLAYLSNRARDAFRKIAEELTIPWFAQLSIVASNDINEETILSLNDQHHQIDCFGIGTHLVTCQKQPALGCVYKLVEINKQPKIKLSEDLEKVTIPGRKDIYRLYGSDGHALIDLMQKHGEPPPLAGNRVLCRHPFLESKRAYVNPARVEPLLHIYWQNGRCCQPLPSMEQLRHRVQHQLGTIRQDHKRNLNPTPYKVSVSDSLYSYLHKLWLQNAPIGELS